MVLEGKPALLTGASRGIGKAIALRLAREKVLLALCGRDARALESLAGEVERLSGRPPFIRAFDLASEPAVLEFYRDARSDLGPPEILINNAGFISRRAPVWEMTTMVEMNF